MTNASSGAATPHPREQLTRRALTVWAAALLFYVTAILGRTSFGVAGVHAIERFEVDASRIAAFTAVQVGVYALSQIPMGLLIDRFGPRRVLVVGAVVMATGQIILGLTGNYWVAIFARVLIGAGDASAFLSVMRILPYWFPLRLTPIFTQLTASIGQFGQFLSAVPFLALLGAQGWTTAFVSIGAVSLLIALAGGAAIADAPEGPSPSEAAAEKARTSTRPQRSFWYKLFFVLRHPACWQAFFIHWTAMLWQVVFTLLWGTPLMALGMGLDDADVGLVLTLNTLTTVLAGPIIGIVSQRAGKNRDKVAFVAVGILAASWLVFLLPNEARGLGAIIAINIIMGCLTGVSNYGFDGIRETLPRSVVATGTGLGNMGGFIAGMIASQAMGILLDYSSQGVAYGWGDFRFAWVAGFVIWGVGIAGFIVAKIMLKRRLASDSQG